MAGILRKAVDLLVRAVTGRRTKIRLTDDGFDVVQGLKTLDRIHWSALESVLALRTDEGRVCLDFHVRHAKEVALIINEEMPGYAEMVERMQQALPGCQRGWHDQGAFPTFATRPVLVWACSATAKPLVEPLVAALRENPKDANLWLVFADWLEERGDPRGAFIRKRPLLSPPWTWATDDGDGILRELRREVNRKHPLHGKDARLLATRCDTDDVLFLVDGVPKPFAKVHLTWRGAEEVDRFPWTTFYASFDDWSKESMIAHAVGLVLQDEYRSFAPGLCRLLYEGANEDAITSYLGHIRRDILGGAATDEERDRLVARRLLDLVRE